jgi:hypothetical protein
MVAHRARWEESLLRFTLIVLAFALAGCAKALNCRRIAGVGNLGPFALPEGKAVESPLAFQLSAWDFLSID